FILGELAERQDPRDLVIEDAPKIIAMLASEACRCQVLDVIGSAGAGRDGYGGTGHIAQEGRYAINRIVLHAFQVVGLDLRGLHQELGIQDKKINVLRGSHLPHKISLLEVMVNGWAWLQAEILVENAGI